MLFRKEKKDDQLVTLLNESNPTIEHDKFVAICFEVLNVLTNFPYFI